MSEIEPLVKASNCGLRLRKLILRITLLLITSLRPKTINDVFTVVRGVWKDALYDGVITNNPLDQIKNIDRNFTSKADPFSRQEINILDKAKTTYSRREASI